MNRTAALPLLACLLATSAGAADWNRTTLNVAENGNVAIATRELAAQTPEQLRSSAEAIPMQKVTSKLFSSLGKAIKVTGKVTSTEELSATTAALYLAVPDKNGRMGVTTVYVAFTGDLGAIESNDTVTCAGYLVGTTEGHNLMGGAVPIVVLVGNACEKPPAKKAKRK